MGAAVAAFGFGRLPGEMRDFEVYWTAAGRALAAEPLYRTADEHYQFKYLPAFAVLASPIAFLPLPVAKALWFVLSTGLLVAVIGLSIAIVPERRRPAAFIAAVIVVTMAKFYGHELVLGQVNLLFAAAVLFGLVLLVGGRDMAAAVLFVGAMVVKPYAVLLLPWHAVRRGWRAAAATAAAGFAALLLPVALYGLRGTIDLHWAWWLTVTESTAPNLMNPDNVSIAGFFAKWFGSGSSAGLAAAIVSAGFVVLFVFLMSRADGLNRREMLEGAVLLTLIPLLSPQGWDYVFLVATPAVALLANYDRALPPVLRGLCWAAMLTIGLSVFDLMGREQYATFMRWSVLTICFIVIVAGLSSLRLRRIA